MTLVVAIVIGFLVGFFYQPHWISLEWEFWLVALLLLMNLTEDFRIYQRDNGVFRAYLGQSLLIFLGFAIFVTMALVHSSESMGLWSSLAAALLIRYWWRLERRTFHKA